MGNSEFIQWLLAAETPSIRYLTMRDLLDLPEDDPQVVAARRAIMTTGPVPTILAGQTEGGNWAGESSYYSPKYVSTHWSMLLLAELAADGQDERLQRGAEYMLEANRSRIERAVRDGTRSMFPCFCGNVLRYALHCGRAGDPRVGDLVRYLSQCVQREDWRCQYNGELRCAWGAARAAWGLAALPPAYRTPEVEGVIESALNFLLAEHHLTEGDYPTSGSVHSLWSRISFPLFYQADILFVLRVLGDLGRLDRPGAQVAL
ncbi:MAG: hypothetical protein A2Y73_04415, partial [Chloroflexi bacterium RBG_13_56_8]